MQRNKQDKAGSSSDPLDLPLYDERPLARSHCRIECTGGGYSVCALGSLSGTIVNGVAIGSEHPSLTAALTAGENTIGPVGSRHQYWIMIG